MVWQAVVIIASCVAGVAAAGWLAAQLRWRWLIDRLGSFPCILIDQAGGVEKDRWGAMVFDTETLRWYPKGSLAPRPTHEWLRRGLTVAASDYPARAAGVWETVRLTSGGDAQLLILSPGASAGLISWIEAGPTRPEPFLR